MALHDMRSADLYAVSGGSGQGAGDEWSLVLWGDSWGDVQFVMANDSIASHSGSSIPIPARKPEPPSDLERILNAVQEAIDYVVWVGAGYLACNTDGQAKACEKFMDDLNNNNTPVS